MNNHIKVEKTIIVSEIVALIMTSNEYRVETHTESFALCKEDFQRTLESFVYLTETANMKDKLEDEEETIKECENWFIKVGGCENDSQDI